MDRGRAIFAHFGNTLAAKLVQVLGTLAAQILVGRMLGPFTFGQFSYVLGVSTGLAVFVDLGMNLYVFRETARSPGPSRALLREASVLKAVALGATVAGSLALAAAVPGIGLRWGWLIALGIAYAGANTLTGFSGLWIAYSRGHERMGLDPELKILERAGAVCLLVPILLVGGGVHGALLAHLLPAVFCSIWGLGRIRSLGSEAIAGANGRLPGPLRLADLVRLGWPFALSALLVWITFRVDSILLFHLTGATEVGWYNAGYNLVNGASVLPLAVATALFPEMARSGSGAARVKELLAPALRLLAAFAFPLGFGTVLLAPAVIRLFYGAAYEPAVLPLAILVWAEVSIFFSVLLKHTLYATGRERVAYRVTLWGSILNVAVNLVVIPRYGMLGASATTVATEVFQLVACLVLMWDEVGGWRGLATACAAAVPSAILFALCLWAGVGAIVPALGLWAALYPGLLFATGAVKRSDLVRLRELLGGGGTVTGAGP